MQSATRQRAIFLLLAAVNVACSVDVHVLDGDIQQLLRMEAVLLKQQGRHDSEVALFQPLQNIAGIILIIHASIGIMVPLSPPRSVSEEKKEKKEVNGLFL